MGYYFFSGFAIGLNFATIPYLYLQNDGEAPVNQSSTEDLLDFTAEECPSTDTHLLTFDIPDHRDLDTSLELNRQLHARLRRKQEEISALRDANAQLRKLTEQAEHYSTTLDVFTTSHHVTTSTPKTNTEITEGRSTGSQHAWISLLTREDQSEPSYTSLADSTSTDPASGVKRQLWSSWSDLLCEEAGGDDAEDTRPDYETDCKRLRLDDELVELDLEQLEAQLDQNEWTPQPLGEESDLTPNESLEVSSKQQVAPVTERVSVFGAFRGLRVVTETPFVKSDLGETNGVCFKISIREHSTVKTKVFPHGKAFTAHTPSGSCRFLWVPSED
ncbi:multicilin [Triplophysa rosa]|uniref:multicilin n=1 Tax=Triplophysa rosa TaxID=992332 RepID=UPI002545D9BB|nr:multicilin [Triplophysa rosa]